MASSRRKRYGFDSYGLRKYAHVDVVAHDDCMISDIYDTENPVSGKHRDFYIDEGGLHRDTCEK